MREIKFRAWDVDNMSYSGTIGSPAFNEWHELLSPADMPIMQFTGLKDKNDKEIYEGDIVKSENGRFWEIEFDTGSFGAARKTVDLKAVSDWISCSSIAFEDLNFEVIGNIYENPELLK